MNRWWWFRKHVKWYLWFQFPALCRAALALILVGLVCAVASQAIQTRHGPGADGVGLAVVGPLLVTIGLIALVRWMVRR